MKQPKNILIIRTDRIGDVVLSLPMAAIIKKHFPGCKITFMLREYTKPLAENNPDIDEIILLKEVEGKAAIRENIKQVKEKNFDVAITVHPSFRIALFLFLSGIKTRIGTGYRLYSFLFNKKIFEHRKYGTHHELEHNIKMLTMIGIDDKFPMGSVPYNIHISDKSRHKVNELLASKKVNSSTPIVIIHPGSGGSSVDWPLYSFQKLIELMARELKVNILVTGGKHEFDLCEKLVVHKNVVNLAGQFNLSELTALIEKSMMMIANSTGPIHIASALGKHVVGFYPKIKECSQKRWGPYTNKKLIFEPTICEGNCTREQCKKLKCMNSINVADVFAGIKNIFDNHSLER